jgi:hypothetical protein
MVRHECLFWLASIVKTRDWEMKNTLSPEHFSALNRTVLTSEITNHRASLF